MLFHAPEFLFVFLPITFSLWLALDRFAGGGLRWLFLVIASVIFYGYFRWEYVFLLVGSMTLNFMGSQLIVKARNNGYALPARVLLITFVAINIGLLGTFKYADFAVLNFNAIASLQLPAPHLVVPLAISFYTFQQIAYLVDVYHDPGRSVSALEYTFFTTFFPHLIAGPICYSSDIVPQMHRRRSKEEIWVDVQAGFIAFVFPSAATGGARCGPRST